ncbi:hypothetical protein Goari_000416 [Gossypium aridum]|uniref:Uncharacterized protein n=1 Tax=Gossypium aridum TaxID=34290 RepID=A0A7J8YI77_GOSAI|nr:hypothetical protein [Gossypium aridum]
MGKKRVMVPAKDLDLSTVKYEHENLMILWFWGALQLLI